MSIALEPRPTIDPLERAQAALRRRLEVVRRRLRWHLAIEGLFWLATALFTAAATSLVLDRLLRFNLATRLGLLTIVLAAIGWLVARRLVQPLLLPLDPLDLAELLDRRSPGVGQQ